MFRLFFGSPGCGKTTTAVQMIYKDRRQRRPLYDYHYANFDCTVARRCNLMDLGKWTFPEKSYVVVDEAGVIFNNRRWEKMSPDLIEWMKEHRHYGVDVDFFSQSWEDCDATIRRLVDEVWHLKKLGPFTLCRRIRKRVDIDEHTHQPMDMYYKLKLIKRFLPFPFNDKTFRLVYRSKYYKYFDSYERKPLDVCYFGSINTDEKIPGIFRKAYRKIKTKIYPPKSETETDTAKDENREEEQLEILDFNL